MSLVNAYLASMVLDTALGACSHLLSHEAILKPSIIGNRGDKQDASEIHIFMLSYIQRQLLYR